MLASGSEDWEQWGIGAFVHPLAATRKSDPQPSLYSFTCPNPSSPSFLHPPRLAPESLKAELPAWRRSHLQQFALQLGAG